MITNQRTQDIFRMTVLYKVASCVSNHSRYWWVHGPPFSRFAITAKRCGAMADGVVGIDRVYTNGLLSQEIA